MERGKLDKLFLLNVRKIAYVILFWFVAVFLHNILYGMFKSYYDARGGDEALFFIIAVIVIPVYFIIASIYTLVKKIGKKKKNIRNIRLKNIPKKIKSDKMRLDGHKFGLAGGIVLALYAFFSTLLRVFFRMSFFDSGVFINFQGVFGYKFSLIGAIFGGVGGFICGFIGFGLFAWIYNKLLE